MTAEDPLSLLGEVLDGTYRLDALVGEGGFGVVYRAHHLGFEEDVAVKCLKIPGALSPQTREAFLRKFREEGKLLSKLAQQRCRRWASLETRPTCAVTHHRCPVARTGDFRFAITSRFA